MSQEAKRRGFRQVDSEAEDYDERKEKLKKRKIKQEIKQQKEVKRTKEAQ